MDGGGSERVNRKSKIKNRKSNMFLRSAILTALLLALVAAIALHDDRDPRQRVPPGRREVVFWHFWGGKDRPVVEEIVDRFNASQDRHFVRAIAMPGNNLDLKFFLGVAGGDPPDVLNQDDPIVADWAHRGALVPLDELATPAEIARLEAWLFPAARHIGSYQGRMYALCNGLDIRALYYDRRALDELGLQPPTTLAELDTIAQRVAPPDAPGPRRRYGFLPDPRRLWAWGVVFGGQFQDPATGRVTADSEPIVAALDWMASYSRRYGADEVAAFRTGDQALTGASFPLLEGRYVLLMDGQWRVAEMTAAQEAARREGRTVPEYGVVPLPPPPGGRERAGWVNGNFFVVPRGAGNPEGAWEFMKFWSGFDGHEAEAARASAAGGWIPAAQAVVDRPEFQEYLDRHPPFRVFVDLAGSPNQFPTPVAPGAAYFYSEVVRAAEDAMYRGIPPREALTKASDNIRARLHQDD
jgi:multiple sugar transport system substrate-binding protein